MAEASIPVDLLNPGQVFACLGLMEANETLGQQARGRFEYEGSATEGRFVLETEGDFDPVLIVIEFLTKCRVTEIAPVGWNPAIERKKTESDEKFAKRIAEHATWLAGLERSADFPMPPPESRALLLAALRSGSEQIVLDYWADDSNRPDVKFWAGSGGYPGAEFTEDALNLVRPLGGNALGAISRGPFSFQSPQSSSFRFDWRRDYTALDVGFSPNDHKSWLTMVGYPFVELLAAIGMQNARPAIVEPRDKLNYRYGISSTLLPTVLARAVLGGENLGVPVRIFRMQLGWPGQEGQARCIIDAQEELA